MTSYEYPVSACDVVCKSNLERYREKRDQWIGWLDVDPVHAITNQLHDMMWNDVTYRTFNEARRLDSNNPTAAVAPLLSEFIDVGYVAMQVLAISKLTDPSDPKKPKRAVISLRRLVDEVSAERMLITRENYIAFDGLPYDPRPAKEKHEKSFVPGQITWGIKTGPDAWWPSEMYNV